mmetsp:Transcript_10780/g.17390  ORF Transcript_10780/g.17390 Transcript_10780/m.17390 type:complete len:501 (+) Transcript_10780:114-1616(+)
MLGKFFSFSTLLGFFLCRHIVAYNLASAFSKKFPSLPTNTLNKMAPCQDSQRGSLLHSTVLDKEPTKLKPFDYPGPVENKKTWTLYGEEYDFEAFAKAHPGGELAIRLGQGEDCTRLFESYHVFSDKHMKVMEKFRISKEKDSKAPALMKRSAFHEDLKVMVREHFAGRPGLHPHRATKSHLALVASLGVATAACWYGWFQGKWAACLALPFVHWVFENNLSHDSSHFAAFSSPTLNHLGVFTGLPFIYSVHAWYAQHVMAHHTGTNEPDLDVDLHHMAPIAYHPSMKAYEKLNYGVLFLRNWVLACLALTVTYPFQLGLGHWFAKVDKVRVRWPVFFDTQKRYWVVNFAAVVASLSVYVIPFFRMGGAKAAAFAAFPTFVASSLFMLFTQVSHIHPETQSEQTMGEEDWFKRQATTSMDYSTGSHLWSVLSGGLNNQALHHCLPSVSCCHYTDLYPKFQAVCEKHSVPLYRKPSLWHALKAFFGYINLMNERGPKAAAA